MATLESTFFNLGYLETLAQRQSVIHKLDPRAKLITTLIFILTVMSFGRYDLSGVIPFLLYPISIIVIGNLPFTYLAKRMVIVLPFIICIGILNPFFDQAVALKIGPLTISGGWISFFSIVIRAVLTVFAALTLIATTGFYQICIALQRIGVPSLFAAQLLFVYRYLFVLIDEAARMVRARSLRSFSRKGEGLKSWGSLIGNLVLKTFDRAQRIHVAMASRGFDGKIKLARHYRFQAKDVIFSLGWTGIFVIMRLFNISAWAGYMIQRIFT